MFLLLFPDKHRFVTSAQLEQMSGWSCYGAFGNEKGFRNFLYLGEAGDMYRVGDVTIIRMGINFTPDQEE